MFRVREEFQSGALARIEQGGRASRVSVRINANWIEARIRDPESKVLREPRLHELGAELQVVLAARIGNVRFDAETCKPPLLGKRHRSVVEDIRARIIINLILTEPSIHRQQRAGAE